MTGRLARAAAIGVLLAAASISTTWGLLFVRPLPTVDGYYRMLGLHERGEVVRDIFGIPRVYANDAHDLWFLQGYVTAQDRLVQMEQMREIARNGGHPIDPHPLTSMPPPLRGVLDAYAEGVTKLIDQLSEAHALPGELVVAGRRPAPWTAIDVLAIAEAFVASAPFGRSRCVVVPGASAARGRPLLGADLGATAPAPGFYEIGLARTDVRAIGISLPGVPALVAGSNGWIAWSLGAVPFGAHGAEIVNATTLLFEAGAVEFGTSTSKACIADLSGAVGGLPGTTAEGSGHDIESVRALLGWPGGPVGARIVIDLADVDTSRSAVSQGSSGYGSSGHSRDQAPIWEIGRLHALPLSRPPLTRQEGDLVLRAR